MTLDRSEQQRVEGDRQVGGSLREILDRMMRVRITCVERCASGLGTFRVEADGGPEMSSNSVSVYAGDLRAALNVAVAALPSPAATRHFHKLTPQTEEDA